VILRVHVRGDVEPRTDLPLAPLDNRVDDQLVGNLRQ
jgi:hypothetical protein